MTCLSVVLLLDEGVTWKIYRLYDNVIIIINKHSFELFMCLSLPVFVFVEHGHDHNSSDQTESKLKTVRK